MTNPAILLSVRLSLNFKTKLGPEQEIGKGTEPVIRRLYSWQLPHRGLFQFR